MKTHGNKLFLVAVLLAGLGGLLAGRATAQITNSANVVNTNSLPGPPATNQFYGPITTHTNSAISPTYPGPQPGLVTNITWVTTATYPGNKAGIQTNCVSYTTVTSYPGAKKCMTTNCSANSTTSFPFPSSWCWQSGMSTNFRGDGVIHSYNYHTISSYTYANVLSYTYPVYDYQYLTYTYDYTIYTVIYTTVIHTNDPPIAGVDYYARASGVSLNISIADLLANDSDPNGDAFTLAGVSLTTTNGVTLTTNATTIIYANSNNVNDSFTYTISDSYGDTGTGTVLINFVPVPPQGFTTLHSFTGSTDGLYPYDRLVLLGNTLYGTTYFGGNSGNGTVFAVNTDGSAYRNLHDFTALHNSTNNDGAGPFGGLVLSGNTLYGTSVIGGSSSNGTVFAVNLNGTGFTNLHSFMGSDGAHPHGGLILSGNTLYGTTYEGGAGAGAVFKVNTDGTGFTNLHRFTGSDGANLLDGLILSGTTLYGAAFSGGSAGMGTVFAISTDGTSFTNLYDFTNGSDGGRPRGDLILSGNTLYGTAFSGGSSSKGAVFAVGIDGTGFTNLHSFAGSSGGDGPQGSLILSGNTLYGTTAYGGSSGNGIVFAVNTDGAGFVNLYSFTASSAPYFTNSDGANPRAGLILSGNTLYGMAWSGGSAGYGMVFSFTLPNLTFAIAGSAELQAFAGSNCPVRFVASAVSGGVANYLQTNDVTLAFTNGVAAYSLPVPANTTHLSAKTAWHLRRRQAVNFTNGVATVDFTGPASLLGGDLVTVAGSTNIVDTDNLVDLSDYDTAVTDFLHSGDSNTPTGRADLTGDGIVNILDYDKLVENFLQQGDPQ